MSTKFVPCTAGDYVKFMFRNEERLGTIERETWEEMQRLWVIRERHTEIRRRVKQADIVEVLIRNASKKR